MLLLIAQALSLPTGDLDSNCSVQNRTYEVRPNQPDYFVFMNVTGYFKGDKDQRKAYTKGTIPSISGCTKTLALDVLKDINNNYSAVLNCQIKGPFPSKRVLAISGQSYLEGFGTAKCEGNITVVPVQAAQ